MNESTKNNFVFFGSPVFAAAVLAKLIEAGFAPQAVVCNPDRPFGRKKIITPPAVKQSLATSHWPLEIIQPEKLAEIKDKLIDLKPDFFIVAAYGKILKKEILDIPRLGTIGVHPSLLPRHRGPSPIQQTILDGDMETGVSLFMIDEKVDNGPVIATGHWPLVNSEKYEELENKLANLGANLLIKTLPRFVNNEIKPVPQEETKATYTKKFTTEDGFVDLEKDGPVLIERKIRALNPDPGVWTMLDGKRTKLLEAKIKDGQLVLKKIQIEGKKPREI